MGLIAGKTIDQWKTDYPLLDKIIATEEVLWLNQQALPFEKARKNIPLGEKDVREAEERLLRFAPFIAKVFPETKNGTIESPLVEIPKMHSKLVEIVNKKIPGKLLLKCDNELPIAGSIKARGGIYEVLKHAEELAIENHLLKITDDYSIIATERFQKFFSNYSIVVGSTGNLGLSIGIISAKLGFHVQVHMSSDAKQWKKDLLRSKGVTVVEHSSDYSEAVKVGRHQAESDPNSYFVDDENSINLFLGYAVAAFRLKKQLDALNIVIDEEHPLFVYLPCGVGGAPGGITFGLKLVFQDHVHCFFAEPTHAPCMLLGLMTGLNAEISVQDFGIDNQTDADGLAVGRPSALVGKFMKQLLNGVYTVDDSMLYILLSHLIDEENVALEPSALAGVYGPVKLFNNGEEYFKQNNFKLDHTVHISWATGGSLVPEEIMESYYQKGVRHKLNQ
jgi:D-serine dehydratase